MKISKKVLSTTLATLLASSTFTPCTAHFNFSKFTKCIQRSTPKYKKTLKTALQVIAKLNTACGYGALAMALPFAGFKISCIFDTAVGKIVQLSESKKENARNGTSWKKRIAFCISLPFVLTPFVLSISEAHKLGKKACKLARNAYDILANPRICK